MGREWVSKLSDALWAYRIAYKTPNLHDTISNGVRQDLSPPSGIGIQITLGDEEVEYEPSSSRSKKTTPNC